MGGLPVPDPSNLRKYINTLILTPLIRDIQCEKLIDVSDSHLM